MDTAEFKTYQRQALPGNGADGGDPNDDCSFARLDFRFWVGAVFRAGYFNFYADAVYRPTIGVFRVSHPVAGRPNAALGVKYFFYEIDHWTGAYGHSSGRIGH